MSFAVSALLANVTVQMSRKTGKARFSPLKMTGPGKKGPIAEDQPEPTEERAPPLRSRCG
jgi:hypothetical protein